MNCINWTAGALFLVCATGAVAADQPETAPTRPVTVTYRVSAGQATDPGKLEVIYDKDAVRVRMDFYRMEGSEDPDGTVIFDKPADRVVTFVSGQKAYLQRRATGLANPGLFLSPDLTYTRKGTETFAGLSCTDWAAEVAGAENSACVTDDGVVLEGTRGGPHPRRLEAITINYGPPTPGAFAIPAGYTRVPEAPAR